MLYCMTYPKRPLDNHVYTFHKLHCFNLSKVFIKLYNTDIPIATVYFYCFWILCVLLPTLHTLTTHVVLAVSYTIVPFSSTESLTEYHTCSLGHNQIIVPVSHRHIISFFQIYITWFLSCTSYFIKWWGLGSHAYNNTQESCWTIIITHKCIVV